MPATATDRLSGLTTSVAVKAPVAAVATAPITLSGLQTVGIVSVNEDDRVLVTAQSNPIDNGIYTASSSDWQRALDFDGTRDVVNGTLVVQLLANGNGAFYQTYCTDDPVIPGTSAIAFLLRDNPNITYAQTAAEIAASIVPTNTGYPPYDIRRYGGDSTGVIPCDTAFNSAVAVCGTAGGTIRVPAGIYLFASLNTALNAKTSIIIQGDGAATGGAPAATKFQFSGTGTGVWFSMNSAVGVQFRGIQFVHTSASFTGTCFQCGNDGSHGDPHDCALIDCTIGANVGTGTIHLDLNKCILFRAERCEFSYGNPSVTLAKTGGGYSNVIVFRDCTWASNYVAPVQNISSSVQAILFDACNFEQLTTGGVGALLSAASTAIFDGVTFTGCWFGDGTLNSGSWLDIYGAGLSFTGNYISGGATPFGTGITLRNFAGASIKGSVFANLVNGVNLAVGPCNNIEIAECPANAVTNYIINGNNAPTGQLIWYPNFGISAPPSSNHGIYASPGFRPNPDGTIEAWGTATVTTGTPLTITYAGAGLPNMPTATLAVDLNLASPSGATNSVYLSGALSTTGFTVNVGGTAGTSTVLWHSFGV